MQVYKWRDYPADYVPQPKPVAASHLLGVHDGGWVPIADYRALLQLTRDEWMPSQSADSLARKIVMLPNWNEFGEGHFLLPNAPLV